MIAEWQPWGPALNSFEDTRFGEGVLSVDYTVDVDTRWDGIACLGPQLNTITCTAAGGTTANSGGQQEVTAGGVAYAYVIRGTKWAKIGLAGMTLLSDGTETALAEAATGILFTRSANGTQEMSFFMDNTAMEVITAFGAGATDTHSANNEGRIIRVGGHATPANTIAGLGRSGAAGTTANTVWHNVISGAVTMDASAFANRASITGEAVTFTGFVMDGNLWILGTDNGPYYFDNVQLEFRALVDEIAPNADNCRIMSTWYPLGVVISTAHGLRAFRNLSGGERIGPERFLMNTSPVQGLCTGLAGTENWLYANFYNVVEDDTYLCAGRPRQAGDWHREPISWYSLGRFVDLNSNYLRNIDTLGGRANPTLMGGRDTDAFWMTMGRLSREIDDSNYRFDTGGTLFLTEMRRIPMGKAARVEWIEFETSSCTDDRTIQLNISVDGATTRAVGGAVTTNGAQRIHVPENDPVVGRRVKPDFVFATNVATASPRIEGMVKMSYKLVDWPVDGRYMS